MHAPGQVRVVKNRLGNILAKLVSQGATNGQHGGLVVVAGFLFEMFAEVALGHDQQRASFDIHTLKVSCHRARHDTQPWWLRIFPMAQPHRGTGV